jgi:hypothetical protein
VSPKDQNIKEEIEEDKEESFGLSSTPSAPSLASQPWESLDAKSSVV